MKNFEITHRYESFWISRSMAAVGIVIAYNGMNRYILAGKRGPGCPDEVGKWALPCGYLDYDESLEECISRETKEETGIEIDSRKWQLIKIESDPKKDKRQNVTVRFGCILNNNFPLICYKPNEEVVDVNLIKVSEINNYDWAFNHKELIKLYAFSLYWYKEENDIG